MIWEESSQEAPGLQHTPQQKSDIRGGLQEFNVGGAPNNIAKRVPLAYGEINVHRQQLSLMWLPNVLQEPVHHGCMQLRLLACPLLHGAARLGGRRALNPSRVVWDITVLHVQLRSHIELKVGTRLRQAACVTAFMS